MKTFKQKSFLFLVLALALIGISQLAGQSVPTAQANAQSSSNSEPASAYHWQYFPDLFVNQGIESEEKYIEQF